MKNLIILAVVVLAVWFVFFRKKTSAASNMQPLGDAEKQKDPIDILIADKPYTGVPPKNLYINNALSDSLNSSNLSIS